MGRLLHLLRVCAAGTLTVTMASCGFLKGSATMSSSRNAL